MQLLGSLVSVRVGVDELCMATTWIFPFHRFTEYEDSDEGWCRALGNGREELRPCALQFVDGSFVMHPDIYEAIQKEITCQASSPSRPA